MSCGPCEGIDAMFGEATAERDLKRYRRRGPNRTTRILLDALTTRGVHEATILDIGGGVGAIPNALLTAGAREATLVDASSAYLAAARREAGRQGHDDRVRTCAGDFVEVAPEVSAAHVVTLDRVLCCYRDVEALVSASAARAERLYGVVYPRDAWWTRPAVGLANFGMRVGGKAFRAFVHPGKDVDRAIRAEGLDLVFHRQGLVWQVAVYAR